MEKISMYLIKLLIIGIILSVSSIAVNDVSDEITEPKLIIGTAKKVSFFSTFFVQLTAIPEKTILTAGETLNVQLTHKVTRACDATQTPALTMYELTKNGNRVAWDEMAILFDNYQVGNRIAFFDFKVITSTNMEGEYKVRIWGLCQSPSYYIFTEVDTFTITIKQGTACQPFSGTCKGEWYLTDLSREESGKCYYKYTDCSLEGKTCVAGEGCVSSADFCNEQTYEPFCSGETRKFCLNNKKTTMDCGARGLICDEDAGCTESCGSARSELGCFDYNVYWFDSCGQKTELHTECNDNQICETDFCKTLSCPSGQTAENHRCVDIVNECDNKDEPQPCANSEWSDYPDCEWSDVCGGEECPKTAPPLCESDEILKAFFDEKDCPFSKCVKEEEECQLTEDDCTEKQVFDEKNCECIDLPDYWEWIKSNFGWFIGGAVLLIAGIIVTVVLIKRRKK